MYVILLNGTIIKVTQATSYELRFSEQNMQVRLIDADNKYIGVFNQAQAVYQIKEE